MKKIFLIIGMIAVLGACAPQPHAVLGNQQSQVQTRNIQSRSFDTGDRAAVMRSVIATMQDLGFIIERADERLGTVSGTSFTTNMRMTVTVRAHGTEQMIVRANAQRGNREVTDPVAYQNFFNALSQSLFLDANLID